MYLEDFRQRKEVEKVLVKNKEEIENMQYQLDEKQDNIQVTIKHKSSLECYIANSDKIVEELKQRMFSTIKLLQKYIERANIQVEHDNTVNEAEELRKKKAEAVSSASMSCLFPKYSFWGIKEATCNFDQALKIGEGDYGIIYKGPFDHNQEAIKFMLSHSSRVPLEFQQKLRILSKLRHPNIATFI